MSRILSARQIQKAITTQRTLQNGMHLGLTGPMQRAGAFVRPRFPAISIRHYAQPPGGGGGFPGFSMAPQHQKGEALKEYVCGLTVYQASPDKNTER